MAPVKVGSRFATVPATLRGKRSRASTLNMGTLPRQWQSTTRRRSKTVGIRWMARRSFTSLTPVLGCGPTKAASRIKNLQQAHMNEYADDRGNWLDQLEFEKEGFL